MRGLTEPQRRALEIVAEHGPIRPRKFALLMWPDSPGWQQSYKCGPWGASRGIAMARTGGAYLGKLQRRGWIHQPWHEMPWGYQPEGYSLTEEGQIVLRGAGENEIDNPQVV